MVIESSVNVCINLLVEGVTDGAVVGNEVVVVVGGEVASVVPVITSYIYVFIQCGGLSSRIFNESIKVEMMVSYRYLGFKKLNIYIL